MNAVARFHRTLEPELLAVLRGVSLECPVCGEFVLHEGPVVRCPECEMTLHGRLDSGAATVEWGSQAG